MLPIWQLHEARKRLGEVIAQAIAEGPQVITRRGEEVPVVISSQQYHKLAANPEPLSAFFRASPLVGVDLDLSRDKSAARPEPEL